MVRQLACAALAVCLLPAAAAAQETRAEALEQQRAERARSLQPYQPKRLEKALLYIEEKRIVERLGAGLSGIYPRIGGFTTGSGFALGAGARYAVPWASPFTANLSAAASTKGYQAIDFEISAPELAGGHVALEGGVHWWDYTQEDYFGLGNHSTPEARTSYRYEATHINGIVTVRPVRWLAVGDEIGYLRPDINPGTDSRFPSTEDTFTDETAPGLDRPPRLAYTRLFLDVDYRDQPANTRGGGRYLLQWGFGYDQNPTGEFSYRRSDFEGTQAFPIFDKKRVFAVRLAASHVDPLKSYGRVPFFLSPTLGGSQTIRSYRESRFRDATFVLINAEYRWEAFSGLDLALFWDAGDVGTRLRDIRVKEFKTGWGFGLRFNTNRAVFMRIDVGMGGPEGTRFFWKFGPAF